MLFEKPSKILVSCPPRMSEIVAKEIEELNYTVKQVDRMGVTMYGSLQDCMVLNMNLRTATKVLWQIDSFKAVHPNHLYKAVKKIAWEELIPEDGYLCVDSYTKNDFIRDTRFPNLRVKDAIVDRMVEKTGRRPDSGNEREHTVLYLHWVLNDCAIYFDTSGETIAKHGYRKMPFKAPMMESLAAATILASDWDRQGHFVNPMCGSGTLAIEAALMAANISPGLFRENFGFMHIKGYKEEYFEPVIRLAEMKEKESIPAKIIASDISNLALNAARHNAKAAGVEDLIEFQLCDFRETTVPPAQHHSVVMINPEYGERLGEQEELEEVYRQMGDFFKQSCPGYTGYIFTGNMQLAKKVGLKPKRKQEFYNGTIDCRLLAYELYKGSKEDE
jgi:23S rRNA G2445 N2-methylase RlmL